MTRGIMRVSSWPQPSLNAWHTPFSVPSVAQTLFYQLHPMISGGQVGQLTSCGSQGREVSMRHRWSDTKCYAQTVGHPASVQLDFFATERERVDSCGDRCFR